MKKIKMKNRLCLYLSHSELIENLHHERLQTRDSQLYTYRPELFDFKSKTLEQPADKSDPTRSNKRKRKAREFVKNEEISKVNAELEPFLKEIQRIICSTHCVSLESISRLWEEPTEFPQFRGANSTSQFQTTAFNHNTYLIPPKCKFYNYDVNLLPELLPELEKYDIVIMDMPWRNKYIKRLKKVNQSMAYQMLSNDSLNEIPLQQMVHKHSLVVLWCTNSLQHQRAIMDNFLPSWNLKLVHCLKWFKFSTQGELISPVKTEGYKQPYETIYIACHQDRNMEEIKGLQDVDFIASIPSIIHSHKPPLINWLREYLNDPQDFKGLEIFARYLQPQFTSIGLEVIKLMDKRLYNAATRI
ncbi:N(6)-adenine-specific methyltransferase METTL4 [Stomoxys calcitrans]|uniref:N(6)-adenine-specific methyltransferase METTL4 n=1 Tax=Stomoxys calcitrans TaxID=35570 RepID=UPI0027E363D5|nr:N(6)-adenine-specific methyltransferase METTL4 [Stomoxys calcitrans]